MLNQFEMTVFAEREVCGDSIRLYLVERGPQGRKAARTAVMAPIEEGAAPEPMVRLSPTLAQQLMDRLWDCGLRPSEGSGSAGAMAATERHLEDMRVLATRLLDEVCLEPKKKS